MINLNRDSGEVDRSSECPNCGDSAVQAAEGYQLVRVKEEEDGSKTVDADSGTPVVAVFCNNCEALYLFLAPRK